MVSAQVESRSDLSDRAERPQAKYSLGLGGRPSPKDSGLPATPPESDTHATFRIAAAKGLCGVEKSYSAKPPSLDRYSSSCRLRRPSKENHYNGAVIA